MATLSKPKSKLSLLLSLPVILYLIPVDGIYNGESICIFKHLFDTECWGCGTTRAFFSVMYGNFAQAWEYNPLITVIFPLLLWLWGKEIWRTIISLKKE